MFPASGEVRLRWYRLESVTVLSADSLSSAETSTLIRQPQNVEPVRCQCQRSAHEGGLPRPESGMLRHLATILLFTYVACHAF